MYTHINSHGEQNVTKVKLTMQLDFKNEGIYETCITYQLLVATMLSTLSSWYMTQLQSLKNIR